MARKVFTARLEFDGDEFHLDRLTREYVERVLRERVGVEEYPSRSSSFNEKKSESFKSLSNNHLSVPLSFRPRLSPRVVIFLRLKSYGKSKATTPKHRRVKGGDGDPQRPIRCSRCG